MSCYVPIESEDEVHVYRASGKVLYSDGTNAAGVKVNFAWTSCSFLSCKQEHLPTLFTDQNGRYRIDLDGVHDRNLLIVEWPDNPTKLYVEDLPVKRGTIELSPFTAWNSHMKVERENGSFTVSFQPFPEATSLEPVTYEWELMGTGHEVAIFSEDDKESPVWIGSEKIPVWLLQDFPVKRITMGASAKREEHGGYRLRWEEVSETGFSLDVSAPSRRAECFTGDDKDFPVDTPTDGALDQAFDLGQTLLCRFDYAQPITTIAWQGALLLPFTEKAVQEEKPKHLKVYLVQSDTMPAPSQWGNALVDVTHPTKQGYVFGYHRVVKPRAANWVVFEAAEEGHIIASILEIGVW